MPYSTITKRKTIVQRADPPKPYPSPRNIIIQYEPPQVRVVRQFERLGVTPENPQAYIQRYGASLIDSETLLQQARAAGVIEDIVRRTFSFNLELNHLSIFSRHQQVHRQFFMVNKEWRRVIQATKPYKTVVLLLLIRMIRVYLQVKLLHSMQPI